MCRLIGFDEDDFFLALILNFLWTWGRGRGWLFKMRGIPRCFMDPPPLQSVPFLSAAKKKSKKKSNKIKGEGREKSNNKKIVAPKLFFFSSGDGNKQNEPTPNISK